MAGHQPHPIGVPAAPPAASQRLGGTVPPSAEDVAEYAADEAEGPWQVDGSVLGGYKVEAELGKGEGAMGRVWWLSYPGVPQPRHYAVKRVRLPHDADRRRFLRELQLWADLPAHPHLAEFAFFRSLGDEIAIFSEYVPGGSLLGAIHRGRCQSLETILDIAIQFAWGLHAAHEWGVTHRDVKPANALIAGEGTAMRIKVTDFGSARASDGEALFSSAMTPLYCAPEQASTPPRPLSRQTDVWSWGVSVLHLFAGPVERSPPAAHWGAGPEAGTALEDYLAGRKHFAPGQPALPREVAAVLRRCFQIEPGERWPTLLEAAEALRDVLRHLYDEDEERFDSAHPLLRWLPDFPRIEDRVVPPYERRTADGGTWNDGRARLADTLLAAGEPADGTQLDRLMLPQAGSLRAQAIADLAAYQEVVLLLAAAAANGRETLEVARAEVARAALLVERGVILEYVNDLAGAVANGQEYLEVLRAVLLGERGLILEYLNDLAGALDAYRNAIGNYERLVVAGRSELESDLAGACVNRGAALRLSGQLSAALEDYGRAIEIYERLVAAGSGELENDLARACMNRGNALSASDQLPAALEDHGRAIGICERLVAAGRKELESDLAGACVNRGIALRASGQLLAALEDHGRAIEIYERLVAAGRGELENDLGAACMNRGTAWQVSGQLPAALEDYGRAIGIRERLVAAGRNELEHDLAGACVNRGAALRLSGQLSAALEDYGRAIEIYERLVAAGRSELESGLAGACMNRGAALRLSGQLSAALEDYARAIEIYERLVAAGRSELENDLATACMNRGAARQVSDQLPSALADYSRSIEIYERLVAAGPNDLASDLVTAYVYKVAALRAQGELPEAIELCTRMIVLDGAYAGAWQARAACRTQQSAGMDDRAEAARLIARARDDQRRAIELEPDNEQGALNLVEADLCDGQAQAAFDLAGTLWTRLKVPQNRVICAWLGALAALSAGVPQERWTEYRTLLTARQAKVSPSAWGMGEVEQWLARLRAHRDLDGGTLRNIEEIHRLFLAYFGEAGPVIR